MDGFTCIMMVGMRGCGKSALARALYLNIKCAVATMEGPHGESGWRPCWLTPCEEGGERPYRKAVQAACKRTPGAAGELPVTHIILDACHLLPEEREAVYYPALSQRTPDTFLYVVFSHPNGGQGLWREVCHPRLSHEAAWHPPADRKNPSAAYWESVDQHHSAVAAVRREAGKSGTVVEVDASLPLAEACEVVMEALAHMARHGRGVVGDCGVGVGPSPGWWRLPGSTTEAVMTVALGYNRVRKQIGPWYRPLLFACVAVTPEKHETTHQNYTYLLQLVPPEFLDGKQTQNEFHVTLKFMGNDRDPAMVIAIATDSKAMGRPQQCEVRVRAVVSDAKATALVVSLPPRDNNSNNHYAYHDDHEKDLLGNAARTCCCGPAARNRPPCGNPTPHITIATAEGVSPAYSNILCHQLEMDVEGRSVFFFDTQRVVVGRGGVSFSPPPPSLWTDGNGGSPSGDVPRVFGGIEFRPCYSS